MPDVFSQQQIIAFEHSFRRAVNAVKAGVVSGSTVRKSPFSFNGQTLLTTITIGRPAEKPLLYEFWQKEGTAEHILDSPITVKGATIVNASGETGGQKTFLAFITKMNKGGLKYSGAASGTGRLAKLNRIYLDMAIEEFWKRLEHEPYEGLGWRLTPYKGWAYVNRRTRTGKDFNKEVAVLSAEMPGRKIIEYNPAGTRRLTYDEVQKLGIPGEIYASFRKKLDSESVWQDLLVIWQDRGSKGSVSVWEDGVGAKHFGKPQIFYP
jgi:hypothetical protein